jgi:hypothetical protein
VVNLAPPTLSFRVTDGTYGSGVLGETALDTALSKAVPILDILYRETQRSEASADSSDLSLFAPPLGQEMSSCELRGEATVKDIDPKPSPHLTHLNIPSAHPFPPKKKSKRSEEQKNV